MKKSVAITSSVVLAASLLAAPVVGAVDVGLGVSLNNSGGGSGGYGVSMPLRFGNFLVEPELSIYDYSEDETYPLSPTSNRNYESQEYTLETGVYWRQPVIPSVEMYVGGRVGYFHAETLRAKSVRFASSNEGQSLRLSSQAKRWRRSGSSAACGPTMAPRQPGCRAGRPRWAP